MYLIEMFGVSLVLTLMIELVVARCLGIADAKSLLPICLVNVLTNPVAVLACWVWRLYLPQAEELWLQVPLEVLVVLVEFWIYGSLAKSGWCCKKPFRLSLVANGASWLTGVMLALVR